MSEINTIPGFTPISLFPTLPASGGLDFAAVCVRIVELAMARWHGNSRLGLAGMQERVKILGGKIDIKSRAGEGTEIDVSFHSDILSAATT